MKPETIHWLFFITFFIGGTGLIHLYLWKRLIHDSYLPAPWPKAGAAFLGFMVLAVPGSRVANRLSPDLPTGLLATVFVTWLGVAFLAALFFGFIDSLRLSLWVWEWIKSQELFRALNLKGRKTGFLFHQMTDLQLENADRRILLQRGMAAGSLLTATGFSGLGVSQAFQAPQLVTVDVPLTKLSQEFEGFKILQISDLHVGPTIQKQFVKDLVAQCNEIKPDLVALTGDFVDGSVQELMEHIAPLGELSSQHGCYFVTGNHEYYSGVEPWLEHFAGLGIQVLRNEHVKIMRGQSILQIAGIDDWLSNDLAPGHGPNHEKALENCSEHAPVILLAHQPRGFYEACELGIDYQISGHTHGGQIWPFGVVVSLAQPFVKGHHRVGDKQIYVSCGAGFWGPAIRLGASSEITLHILRKA